jgi:pyruvate carboxylase
MFDPEAGKIHADYYTEMARQLEDAGAHMIAIKDMAGLLGLLTAEVLVSNEESR